MSAPDAMLKLKIHRNSFAHGLAPYTTGELTANPLEGKTSGYRHVQQNEY